MSMSVFDELEP